MLHQQPGPKICGILAICSGPSLRTTYYNGIAAPCDCGVQNTSTVKSQITMCWLRCEHVHKHTAPSHNMCSCTGFTAGSRLLFEVIATVNNATLGLRHRRVDYANHMQAQQQGSDPCECPLSRAQALC